MKLLWAAAFAAATLAMASVDDLIVSEVGVSGRDVRTLAVCQQGCYGNGVCGASGCECYENANRGYWDKASSCSTCSEGFSGLNCKNECPGGSCNQCSGHGTCFDGVTGNGTCLCDVYWVGDACDECNSGFFSPDCTSECDGGAATPCNGKGTCFDGPSGNGTCDCIGNALDGYLGWQSACLDCDDSHYGAQCKSECIGGAGNACSGHGRCNSGRTGDGSCDCSTGWTSQDCSVQCPGSTDAYVCGGKGTCTTDGKCICESSNYKQPGCDNCIDGFTGPNCDERCPVNNLNQPCSNNGICNRDKTCSCFEGYSHDPSSAVRGCQLACPSKIPGGVPCSQNGKCNSDTAQCECYQSASLGYWSGASCDICTTGYSGSPSVVSKGCRLICPRGPGNTICSNKGTCLEGKCFCDQPYCGNTCQTTTGCSNCPVGKWSTIGQMPQCNKDCPTSLGQSCSGHGRCTETFTIPMGETSQCTCDIGYGGIDCSARCANDCSGPGKGYCDLTTVTCICEPGYAGGDCGLKCPVDSQNRICGGLSTCNAVTGFCDCKDCEVPTATGCAKGNIVGATCSACDCTAVLNNGTLAATGTCNPADGSCSCFSSWSGANCDECASGFFGEFCDIPCGTISNGQRTGTTQGRKCKCIQNWAAENCTIMCPGYPSNVCNGGTCNWGADSDGSCSCPSGLYGSDCTVPCDQAKCQHLKNWMCAANGDCACLDKQLQGHWAMEVNSSTCETCKEGWWGADCDAPCDCSTHGTCDRFKGEPCVCYSDSTNGYWDGTHCEKCADGRVGLLCTGIQVAITRTNTIDAKTTVKNQKALLADEEHGYIYTGGNPLVAMSLRVESGAKGSFPRLSASSQNNLGCQKQSPGEAFYLFTEGQELFILLQGENRCPGPRLMKMPRDHSSGKVNFSMAAEVDVTSWNVNGDLTDAKIIAADYNEGVLGLLLLKNTTYYMRSTGIPTPGISCGMQIPWMLSATSITVAPQDPTKPDLYISGTALNGKWTILKIDNSGALSCSPSLWNSRTHYVGAPCDIADCDIASVVKYHKGGLLVSVEGIRGTGLAKFELCSALPCFTYAIQLTTVTERATAIAVDEFIDVAYLAYGKIGQPSRLSKFSFTDNANGKNHPVLYGELDLTWSITSVGFSPETITALYPAPTWRVLYGLTSGNTALRVIPFLLYEVSKVYPPVSDTKGGTPVTITGNGFRKIDYIGPEVGPYQMVCRAGDNELFKPATFINTTTLECETGAISSNSEISCVGDPLEVSMYETSSTFTDNDIKVLRVHSGSITKTIPQKGYHTGKQRSGDDIVVTVTGYGFQLNCAECIRCKFYDSSSPPEVFYVSGSNDVTYISPYEIRCRQPGTVDGVTKPSVDPSFIDVTLDGSVFSGSPVPYTIVGQASYLITNSTKMDLRAAKVMRLPSIQVTVVDDNGHALDEADSFNRLVKIEILKYTSRSDNREKDEILTPTGMTTLSSIPGSCTTTDGVCLLSGVDVSEPVTGEINLSFETTDIQKTYRSAAVLQSASWSTAVQLFVNEGIPTGIKIKVQPSPKIPADSLLPVQPQVILADEMGNFIVSYIGGLQTSAKSFYSKSVLLVSHDGGLTKTEAVPPQVFFSTKSNNALQSGLMKFSGMDIPARFGTTYYLNFTVRDQPLLGSVLSEPMERVSCSIYEFALTNTTTCAPCPTPGARCNGSEIVLTLPGYWRASENSTKFYKCTDSSVCLGGLAAAQVCAVGTTGTLCSVCQQGFGKNPSGGCTECGSEGANLAFVILAFLGVLIGLIIWIVVTLGKTVDRAHTIISRILVSHLQASAVGEFSENWSQFTKDTLNMQGQSSSLSFSGFASLDCLLRNAGYSYYHYFTGYMCLPALPLIIAFAVYAFIVIRRTTKPSLLESKTEDPLQDENGELSKEDLEEEAPSNNIYTYKFPQVLLTTYSVCLFVMYPTLINQAAVMLRCSKFSEETVSVNPSTSKAEYTLHSSKQYLAIDHSIDCDTSKYDRYRMLATVFLVGYGLGIPLAFIGFVRWTWKKRGYDKTYVMFIFLLGGFQCKTWFWQAVIMCRKLALGLIAVFISGKDDSDKSNDSLQSYVAIWVITASLVLQVWVKPYVEDGTAPYNKLEALSLGVIAFTLNIGLLYSWEEMPGALKNCVTVVLAIVTFTTLGIFLYYILKSVKPLIADFLDKDGDGKVTMRDMKLWLKLESITKEEVRQNKIKTRRAKKQLKSGGSNSEGYTASEGSYRAGEAFENTEGYDNSLRSDESPEYSPPNVRDRQMSASPMPSLGRENSQLLGRENSQLLGRENSQLLGRENSQVLGRENSQLLGRENSQVLGASFGGNRPVRPKRRALGNSMNEEEFVRIRLQDSQESPRNSFGRGERKYSVLK